MKSIFDSSPMKSSIPVIPDERGWNTYPWLKFAYNELMVRVARYGSVDTHGTKVLAHDSSGHSISNPKIVQYFKATSLHSKNENTSWCSAYVNWCMQQANLEGTRSAAARSWLKWEGGIHLGSKPAIGSIAVFPRDHNPAQGHVAFVWMVRSDGSIDVLGGNQGGKSATAKTAGTSSHVSIGHHKKGHALDFLWPKSLPLPIAGSDSFIRLKSRSVPRDLKPADYGWEQPGTPMQDGIISRVIIA